MSDYKREARFQSHRGTQARAKVQAGAKSGKGSGSGWQFVVQKHAARRVHYDLRLELGGTLKSWAVTRGPSLVAGEKRLAVRTEDHPMQYLDFEGNIPKGEYGGGAMIVWDRGRWSAAFDPDRGLEKGHLEFTLEGARLKGRWHLVRMRGEARREDRAVAADQGRRRVRTAGRRGGHHRRGDHVALSGRTTEEFAALGDLRKDHAGRPKVAAERSVALPDPERVRGARKGILPAFLEPSLRRQPASRRAVRNGCTRSNTTDTARRPGSTAADVRLLTRKGLDWTARFPQHRRGGEDAGRRSALIDGEIVVEDSAGIPSFALLQADLSANRRDRFRYFAVRSPVLRRIRPDQGDPAGPQGAAGRRSSAHCRQRRRFASASIWITTVPPCSSTPAAWASRASYRSAIDAALSTRPRRPLVQVQSVRCGRSSSSSAMFPRPLRRARSARCCSATTRGTGSPTPAASAPGYSSDQARSLRAQLDKIAAAKPKLANALPAGAEKGVRWVEPRLVCEVEFRAWTADKLIRQGSFKGLREDRAAEDVVLEAAPIPPPPRAQESTAGAREPAPMRGRLTHPDRILWPEQGVTKEGLAEFYTDIADWILPHISGRVLSLLRCPSGVSEKCFFAKHPWHGLSDAVRRDRRRRQGEDAGARRPRWIDRPRAGERDRDPCLGIDRRAAGEAGSADLRSRSRRGCALERGDRSRLRRAPPARRRLRPAKLREDLGRQGPACRAAD